MLLLLQLHVDLFKKLQKSIHNYKQSSAPPPPRQNERREESATAEVWSFAVLFLYFFMEHFSDIATLRFKTLKKRQLMIHAFDVVTTAPALTPIIYNNQGCHIWVGPKFPDISLTIPWHITFFPWQFTLFFQVKNKDDLQKQWKILVSTSAVLAINQLM